MGAQDFTVPAPVGPHPLDRQQSAEATDDCEFDRRLRIERLFSRAENQARETFFDGGGQLYPTDFSAAGR